jgi:hypothetical protein
MHRFSNGYLHAEREGYFKDKLHAAATINLQPLRESSSNKHFPTSPVLVARWPLHQQTMMPVGIMGRMGVMPDPEKRTNRT